MNFKLPRKITTALNQLNKAGYEAYIVGGCVRDMLMHKTPHDFDITTSALPEQTCEVFNGYEIIPTGIKHGTVTVLYEGEPLEITTFRTDGEYSDNRHPDSVTFTASLEKDLARRDFTMNAIAYNPSTGIIDPFNGREDIRSKIIRCVGNPDERFREDALRIMRAMRFSASLDFEIETETSRAMQNNRKLLNNIAVERIYAELIKTLSSPGYESRRVYKILTVYDKIFAEIIPEFKPCIDYSQGLKDDHLYLHGHLAASTEEAVRLTPNDYTLPLAMLLHDIGKVSCRTTNNDGEVQYPNHAEISAEMADIIMKRLKTSTSDRKAVVNIIKNHETELIDSEKDIRKQLAAMSEKQFRCCVLAHIANDTAKAMSCTDGLPMYHKILSKIPRIAKESCLSLKSLAVNGNDLSAIMKPSPALGTVLNQLLSEVINGNIENEHDTLMVRAKEIIKEPKCALPN